MSWTNTLKLTLESSSVVAGLQDILRAANKATGAVGDIAGAAVRAGGKMVEAFKGVGDILFKLPDQVRALQGMLDGLSLPSKLAGSAETTQVAFSVLLGSADKAREILGRIRELANETPFEFPELANSARMLAAFGEEADSIPDTLRRIGDIASGTQTKIGELAEIYGKARVQGTLYAEDINQLTGRGIPVLQQFAEQLGVGVDQVKKMAADGQVTFTLLEQGFKNLTGEGGQFAGMMDAISQTFEGKLSTLGDSFHGLMTALGKGINEGLKPVMDELGKELDGQQGMAQKIGDAIGYGIEVGLDVLKSGEATDIFAAGLELGVTKALALLSSGMSDVIDALEAGLAEIGLVGHEKKINLDETASPKISDELNNAATDKQNALNYKIKKSTDRVDQSRSERAATKEEADAEKERIAGIDAEMREKAKEMDRIDAIDHDEYVAKQQVDAEASGSGAPLLPAPRLPQNDAGPQLPSGPRLPGSSGAAMPSSGAMPSPAGPQRRTIRGARYAAGAASGLGDAYSGVGGGSASADAPDGGRRTIRGAPYAAGAASGLGTAYGGSSHQRADRMAGMANAGQHAAQGAERTADLAMKAATLVLKVLPDMARDMKRTAQNTDSNKTP